MRRPPSHMGRMAGLLTASMQRTAGTVVALCHSQIYAVHRDRVRGFSDFMARPAASHLTFQQTAFTHDDENEIARVASELMRGIPDLAGLYPCAEGAGYAGGIVSAALDGIRVARAITART